MSRRMNGKLPVWAMCTLMTMTAAVREAQAVPVMFERDYTYQASEADSKLTCRAIALEQVKHLLLEELGTYLESRTEVKNSALTKDEIVTYTAGAVATTIEDERWNGESYYMKAKVSADDDEVAKSIAAMRNDREKSAELEQLRAQANESLKEIERLRQELAQARQVPPENSDTLASAVKSDYGQAVARLTAKDYLERGFRLRKAGTMDEAIAAFGEAIAAAPNWYRPYVTRGTAFILKNDMGAALRDFERALQLNRQDTKTASLHALVLIKLDRKTDAVAELRLMAFTSERNPELCVTIGGLLINNKMPGDAVAFLTRSIEQQPADNGNAYYLRALAYSRIGDSQYAMADLRTAARQGNAKAMELLKSGRYAE